MHSPVVLGHRVPPDGLKFGETLMNKFSASLLGVTLFASASFTASATPAVQENASPTFRYWLHPKLGMVKVDRATNAVVKSGPAETKSVDHRSQPTGSAR